MADFDLISADDHFTEPPDLWQSRLPVAFRDQAPRVERTERGDGWVFPNRPWSPMGLGAQAGRSYEDYQYCTTYEEIRPGTYEPRARLEDMDLDGVWASVLYPTTGLSVAAIEDMALHVECVRAYNDFCADFCATDRRRLLGLGLIPRNGVDGAVAELERMRQVGLVGAILQALPSGATWPAADDERFWAAAEEMGILLHIHVGLVGKAGVSMLPLDPPPMNPLLPIVLRGYALIAQGCQDAFAGLIFSGVLERYPGIRWVAVESGIGWLPYYLERWDGVYQRQRHWSNLDLPLTPSEYWRRQVFATFEEDRIGVELAVRHPEYVGVDNLMWASDYPHGDTTWPHSRQTVQEHFQGLPEEARWKITWENARRLYGVETP